MKLIARNEFVLEAPQERVWDLLGKVILQCLPLEQIDVVTESSFNALLRWKLGFITVPLNLNGELVDISAPSSMTCRLQVRKAILRLAVEVAFTLKPVEQGRKTEIVSVAQGGSTGLLPGWVMSRQQRSFAQNTFNTIRKRLELLCQPDSEQ